MRILFLGDIVGRSGRDAVLTALPHLRTGLGLDAVIVNAENAAHGFGMTKGICTQLLDAGVDVLTSGNHVWDQREMLVSIDDMPRVLRPINFPAGTPGAGHVIVPLPEGRRLLVVNAMCRLFMDALDDPFAALDALLKRHPLGSAVTAAVLDFHGEATAEKMAMGHFLDGRASLVVGTHTHVPTADAQVLPGGTALHSDAGMCGDYDSVIGMQKQASIDRFRRKLPGERLGPAKGPATVCGTLVDIDPASGHATGVEMVRIGGRLSPAVPAGAEAAAAALAGMSP